MSFVVSAVSLLAIRTAEVLPVRSDRPRLPAEVAEDVRLVVANPLLRSLGLTSAIANLQFAIASAASVIFFTRVLGLPAFAVGLLVGSGALAAMLGAALTPRLASALGSARVVWAALLVATPLTLVSAFAQPGPARRAARTARRARGARRAGGGGGPRSSTPPSRASSLRQRLCPPQLLSRVNAGTMRVLILALFPAGALLGGVLRDLAGPRTVLIVSGALGLAVPRAVLVGAARRARRQGAPTDPLAGLNGPQPAPKSPPSTLGVSRVNPP